MNKVTAILQLMQVPGIGAKRLSRLLKKLQSENHPIEHFVALPDSGLIEKYGLTQDMATAVKAEESKAQELLDELWKHEIKMILQGDSRYPEILISVLGDNAPPVLFVKGNLGIFDKRAAGFCGSRKATIKGSELVRHAAGTLAGNGINVIGGYAHGVDLAAHIGALEKGGITTFVLPLGILNFQLKSSISELISEDNYLVISEFIPRLGWEVHNAMRRNLTICGLTKAIILVESGIKGGTFEAGKTALKYNRPVFVVEHGGEFDREGNKFFLQKGALPLREIDDGILDIKPVLDAVNSSETIVKQQSLF